MVNGSGRGWPRSQSSTQSPGPNGSGLAASPRRRTDQQSGTGSQRCSSSVRPVRRSRLIATELSCWSSSRPTRSVRISMVGTLAAGCDILGLWPGRATPSPPVGRARPARARDALAVAADDALLGHLRRAVRRRAGGRVRAPTRWRPGRADALAVGYGGDALAVRYGADALGDRRDAGDRRPAARRRRSATPSATRSPPTATRPPPTTRGPAQPRPPHPRPGPVPPGPAARPVAGDAGAGRTPGPAGDRPAPVAAARSAARAAPAARCRRATRRTGSGEPAGRRLHRPAREDRPARTGAGGRQRSSTGSGGSSRRPDRRRPLDHGPAAGSRTAAYPGGPRRAARIQRHGAPAQAGANLGTPGPAGGVRAERTAGRRTTCPGRAVRVRAGLPRGGRPAPAPTGTVPWAGGSDRSGWDDLFAGTGGTAGRSGRQPSGAEVARALLDAVRRGLRDR